MAAWQQREQPPLGRVGKRPPTQPTLLLRGAVRSVRCLQPLVLTNGIEQRHDWAVPRERAVSSRARCAQPSMTRTHRHASPLFAAAVLVPAS